MQASSNTKFAQIYKTDNKIILNPLSSNPGNISYSIPPFVALPATVDSEELGTRLLEILEQSRQWARRPEDAAANQKEYEEFLKLAGTRSYSRFAKRATYCLAEREQGMITLIPHVRSGGGYVPLDEERFTRLSADVEPRLLGEALLACLTPQ